jgi:hypothetical protein
MKSILIEAVANGWLVRPFSPCREWAYGPETPNIFVFTTIDDLCQQLPALLKHQEVTVATTVADAPTCK